MKFTPAARVLVEQAVIYAASVPATVNVHLNDILRVQHGRAEPAQLQSPAVTDIDKVSTAQAAKSKYLINKRKKICEHQLQKQQ
jgi:hypothetical protein